MAGNPVLSAQFNFDYSVSGAGPIVPVQVFDDGSHTFIQFANPGSMPNVAILSADGSVVPYVLMPPYLVVKQLMPGFMIRSGNRMVEVANNSNHPQGGRPASFFTAPRSNPPVATYAPPHTTAYAMPGGTDPGILPLDAAASPVVSVMTAENGQAPAAVEEGMRQSGKMPVAVVQPKAHAAPRAVYRKVAQAAPAPRPAPSMAMPATLPEAQGETATPPPLIAAGDNSAGPLVPVSGPLPAETPVHVNAPAHAPTEGGWELEPGELRNAFAALCKHYGYTLAWKVDETHGHYVFDYPVSLPGKSFIDDVKAVEKMVNMDRHLFDLDVYQENRVLSVKGVE